MLDVRRLPARLLARTFGVASAKAGSMSCAPGNRPAGRLQAVAGIVDAGRETR
jgi:hypothetical protein